MQSEMWMSANFTNSTKLSPFRYAAKWFAANNDVCMFVKDSPCSYVFVVNWRVPMHICMTIGKRACMCAHRVHKISGVLTALPHTPVLNVQVSLASHLLTGSPLLPGL